VLRRLEDRIRELCARVIITRGQESETKLEELKAALAEHTERIRKAAILTLLNQGHELQPDRRRF
jgi:hypothetical protein